MIPLLVEMSGIFYQITGMYSIISSFPDVPLTLRVEFPVEKKQKRHAVPPVKQSELRRTMATT